MDVQHEFNERRGYVTSDGLWIFVETFCKKISHLHSPYRIWVTFFTLPGDLLSRCGPVHPSLDGLQVLPDQLGRRRTIVLGMRDRLDRRTAAQQENCQLISHARRMAGTRQGVNQTVAKLNPLAPNAR
jgi:hypothetical protein